MFTTNTSAHLILSMAALSVLENVVAISFLECMIQGTSAQAMAAVDNGVSYFINEIDTCCLDLAAEDPHCEVVKCVDVVTLQIREDVEDCSCQPIIDGINSLVADSPLVAGGVMALFPEFSPTNNPLDECCNGGAADNPTFNTCAADFFVGILPSATVEEDFITTVATTSSEGDTSTTVVTGATDSPPNLTSPPSSGSTASFALTIAVVMLIQVVLL